MMCATVLVRAMCLQKWVVACVTDADTSADGAPGWMLRTKLMGPGGAPQLYDYILALRGLLGCGVLRHGLLLRHQVEYGIDRSGPGRQAQGMTH